MCTKHASVNLHREPMPRFKPAFLLLTSIIVAVLTSCGSKEASNSEDPKTVEIVRVPSAPNGRALFVDKGCVLCHSINGVGGKAATPLDAQTEFDTNDPVEFAARMWRGAPAMVELQSLELGYTIWLEAEDIVDLAALTADAAEQKKLTNGAIPEGMRDALLDQRFWEFEDWDGFLKEGQEGFNEPRENNAESPEERENP